MMTSSTAPVLIVGGGPVGLALAIELGTHHIPSVILEQGDESMPFPTANRISARTMEYLRRWGLADAVRYQGFPADFPKDTVYTTGIDGYEIVRFPHPANGNPLARWAASPEGPVWSPKLFFDPLLRRKARSMSLIQLRYHTQVLGFTQSAEGVTVQIRHQMTGAEEVMTGQYLVGCDGGRSLVRHHVGIAMEGRFAQDQQLAIFFLAALGSSLRHPPAVQTWILKPEVRALLVSINGQDLWRTGPIGLTAEQIAERTPAEWLRLILGEEVPFAILGVSPWGGHYAVAEQYRVERVFLAGDAAHLTWPAGGFGMNTGIGDAVDLGWKLAGTLAGWGGPHLLDSYEAERRPVAVRNVMGASEWRAADATFGLPPTLNDATEEGERTRQRLGEMIAQSPRGRQFATELPGVDLGVTYEGSPICIADGTPPPPVTDETYLPSARPGARAPHVVLADGRSLLDHLSMEWTLLRSASEAHEADAFMAEATRRHLPLTLLDGTNPAVQALYERRWVVIRPDGHIAWRADTLPDHPAVLFDIVCGYSSSSREMA